MSDALRRRLGARRWPLGVRSTALLATACAATGAAAGVLVVRLSDARPGHALVAGAVAGGGLRADAVWPAGRRPAPPFALRDQSNRLVSLASRRGTVVLLAFMDSHCRFICMLEGPALSDVQRRAGAAAATLLVVSVNPWEDTAASSRAAGARWGLQGDWHWLRGSPAQLRRVWRDYGIEVARAAGDVNHSTAIYLIDGRGYERAGFNYPFPVSQVVRDVRRLAPREAS